ncbi:MAG: TlyA family RNA methyltransferase, partial [Spirochaetales bacterium]|nr:TlyA family RNA methyltransferase [Spirochaetales bacterium]
MKKITLLELTVKNFNTSPRNLLYSKIMCGKVLVDGVKNSNPGSKVYVDSSIEIIEKEFVSRGGLKLKAALDNWDIDVHGKVFIDAGSSTGGFTDCLLGKGADHVYAVDVGYNQLAYSLRTNDRVSVFEKTNIMHLNEQSPVPAAAVADLSFRSISGAGRHIINLTTEKW